MLVDHWRPVYRTLSSGLQYTQGVSADDLATRRKRAEQTVGFPGGPGEDSGFYPCGSGNNLE
jgi:hypothetical protein